MRCTTPPLVRRRTCGTVSGSTLRNGQAGNCWPPTIRTGHDVLDEYDEIEVGESEGPLRRFWTKSMVDAASRSSMTILAAGDRLVFSWALGRVKRILS